MADIAKPTGPGADGPSVRPFAVALFVVIAVFVAGNFGELAIVSYRVATAPAKSNATFLAQLDGRLFGQANADGTACFWVVNGTDRTALSWPWGYAARGSLIAPLLTLMDGRSLSRLEVDDDAGRRVAALGDEVTFAGGLLPENIKSITGCSGFRNFWVVGKVV